jgi:predicted transcriptional regulator
MAKVVVKLTQNFTTIPNEILKNKEISLSAKGLLITMLSLPDNWNYTVEGLTKIVKEGKDKVRSSLTELINSGYVTRERERNKNGTLGGTVYTVYQKPVEPKTVSPKLENPTQDEPILETTAQLNTNIQNTKRENKKENKSMRVCSFSLEKEVSPSSKGGTLSPTIIKAIDEAMTEEGETPVSSFREELKDITEYFVNEYARTQGKPHKPLTRPAISNIVYNYLHQDEDEYGIMDDVWTLDQYIPLIDMYMQTNYRDGIEKSLSHFMSGSIRRNLKAKLIE